MESARHDERHEKSRSRSKPEEDSTSFEEADLPRQQKARQSLYGPLQTTYQGKAFADHRVQHASNHHIPPFALSFPAS